MIIKSLMDYIWSAIMPIPSRHFKPGYCRVPTCGGVADSPLGYCAGHRERRCLGLLG